MNDHPERPKSTTELRDDLIIEMALFILFMMEFPKIQYRGRIGDKLSAFRGAIREEDAHARAT